MEMFFYGRSPETFLEGTFKVSRATDEKDFMVFKRLQFEPYLDNPNRSPRLPGFFELLFSSDNPMWRHMEAEVLIARRGDRPIGTIVVGVDERLNERYNKRIGIFGFLEAIELDSIPSLIKAAETRLKERNVDEIRGPINLSMEYNAGFLLYPHDEPAPIFVNYTRKEYPKIIESLGYKKLIDLVGLEIDLRKIPEKAFDKPKKVLQEYRFEHVRKKEREHYLDIILELTLDAFKDHRAFAKKDKEDLRYVFGPFKDLVDEKMARIAYDGDEPIGYTVRVPDYADAFRKIKRSLMKPKLGILDRLRLARHVRKVKAGKTIASGVKEEYRKRGIGSTLNYLAIKRMMERGFTKLNYSRIVETNTASIRNGMRRGGVEKERRRVYVKNMKK